MGGQYAPLGRSVDVGDVTEIRRFTPPVRVVCGLYVVLVDGEWWVCRWSTPDERRDSGLHFQAVDGPTDDVLEAERWARRRALRPVPNQEEQHA